MQPKNVEKDSFLYVVLAKRWARFSALFIALTFENYEQYFFMKF